MLGYSCDFGDREYARCEGYGNSVHPADVFVCRFPAGLNRGWDVEDGACGWASAAGFSDTSGAAKDCGGARYMDAAEGLCQRLRGDDWCRSGVEWGYGVWRAQSEEGTTRIVGGYWGIGCAFFRCSV